MIINNPQKIKKAEIIVGIPSYNEANTIDFVVEQVSLGLEKYFPDKKSVIINVDNHSLDGTEQAFFEAKVNIPRIYISTEKGVKGKGRNFYNLFSIFKKLNAKVGIAVDADLRSFRAKWIKKMAEPILNGYDFITPYYIRCKTDATITNHLVYPLVYGLLGWNLRQPIGGDFAFSKKIVNYWLEEEWFSGTYDYGIDIFMSLTAFFKKAKTGQVNLGSKVHNLSNPKLGPMFFQVVEVLFKMILNNLDKVKQRTEIEKVKILGGSSLPILANANPVRGLFRKTFLDNFKHAWLLAEDIVSPSVREELEKIYQNRPQAKALRPWLWGEALKDISIKHPLTQLPRTKEEIKKLEISLDLWARIVYDFLLAYKEGCQQEEIIKGLGSFYFGRAASFFSENGTLTPEDTEKKVIRGARYFFKHRDYFLNKI
ncbi:MAG: glycosyltransferase [Parcubacteria group bacterium]|nr:glycosyltransferase [Parcubacteria group bacterium]